MKITAGKILRNPVVIIVPLVALALVGWNTYVKALNKPNHATYNLLHNGGFESYDEQGNPRDWTIDANSSIRYAVSREKGYGGGTAMGLQVGSYDKGSLDLKSAIVPLKPDTPYFYKGYYHADTAFALLVKYYFKDGSTSLRLIKEYKASQDWTTASVALQADERIDRVQIIYRMAGTGTIQLDRAYIEENKVDVAIPEEVGIAAPNLITNGGLDDEKNDEPKGWSPFRTGDNKTEHVYVREDGATFLRTSTASHKNGEAKWDHKPVLLESGSYTQFSVDYRSDVPVRVVAEYALDDKKRTFVTLGSLPPADSWTRAEVYAEAPERAVEITVHVVLSANGTLDTDNHVLRDLTKQDVRHFNRPLISLTFDEGWNSSYVTVARILGYLEYKGTFYINPDAIDQPSFLTSGQLDALKSAGHQLGSQGYEHVDLTTLNARQLDRQLRLGKEYFVREYQLAGTDFAPPKGNYDAEVQSYARQYYRSVRSIEEGINTKQNLDAYNLKTLYIDKNTTIGRLQAALEEAQQKSGWLVLVYHRVEDNHPHRTTVGASAFADQLETIRKSGITVKTVEQALDEVWAQ
jgi:peptidoglycan/xylan/chitin deacetylase (PgdA/CDA1 family)